MQFIFVALKINTRLSYQFNVDNGKLCKPLVMLQSCQYWQQCPAQCTYTSWHIQISIKKNLW